MPNPILATAKSAKAQPASATASPTRYGVPGQFPAVEPGVLSRAVDQNASRAVAPAGQVGMIGHVLFRPCQPGETQSACDARERREQDAASRGVLGGSGSGSGSGGSGGNLSDAQVSSIVNGVASGATAIASLITGLVRAGQQDDIERLRIQAASRAQELETQARTASNEAERQRLQMQIDQLNALQQQAALARGGSGMPAWGWALVGVAGVAVVGGVVYVATSGRARRNPTTGTGRNRHFVAAGKRRGKRGKRRGKKGGRRAA